MRDIDFAVYRHAMAQLDEVAAACEARWGVDRLPRLVAADLAAKFYSQLDKLNAALEVGSPADIEYHATRMGNAWRALDTAAQAAGARPLEPHYLEGRLPNGTVLVVCGSREEQWALSRENRAAVVWSMEEIARVLWEFELTNTAKTIFKGAFVEQARIDPERVKPPVDWSKGDALPFDMMGAG
jgi:hypothetical protein